MATVQGTDRDMRRNAATNVGRSQKREKGTNRQDGRWAEAGCDGVRAG